MTRCDHWCCHVRNLLRPPSVGRGTMRWLCLQINCICWFVFFFIQERWSSFWRAKRAAFLTQDKEIHARVPTQSRFNKPQQPQSYCGIPPPCTLQSAQCWAFGIQLQFGLLLSSLSYYWTISWRADCKIGELQQTEQQSLPLSMCWMLICPLAYPSVCVRVCCQDGLSAFSALWDLCYAGAPPLQPCCYDPAKRGALCFFLCCSALYAVSMFLFMFLIACGVCATTGSLFGHPILTPQMFFSL